METVTTTTTKNNLQIIQQAFDDFTKGNTSAIVDVCADDVVWESYPNPGVPSAGRFEGKAGVQDFFNKLSESVNITNFQPKEYIVQGDRVVVLGHNAGTVKSTGKTFDNDWCFTFKMNNGKLQHYFAFLDTRDQAEAFKNKVGLP